MALTLYSIPEADLSLRYREPYISAGLNSKYQGVVPVGVYGGFVPSPAAYARKLLLAAGPSGYSVAVATSGYDATYQVSVQIPGTQTIDLSSLGGKTVSVVLETTYAFPSVTTGVIKAYDLSIESPPAYACVLCQVDVPATAVLIPVASISLLNRTLPWVTQTRDSIPFLSALRDGAFAFGAVGSVPTYWETGGSTGTFAVAATTPPSGYGNVVQATAAGISAQNGYLRQYIGLPITENYGRVRLSLYYSQSAAPASSNPVFQAVFKTPNNNSAQYTAVVPLTATGTAQAFIDIADLIAMSARGAYLDYVEVSFNASVYGSSGVKFSVADVRVELEARNNAQDVASELTGTYRATRLRLLDPTNQSAGAATASLTYDLATDRVTLPNALVVSGAGGVRTGLLDGPVSGASLNIGTTSQTQIILGRAGSPTNLYGSTLSADAVGTLTVGTSSQTSLLIGRSTATTDIGGSITSIDAASLLQLGANTATSVGVGRASGYTTVRGDTVDVGTASTAAVNVGNAPLGGSVVTSVQGNTVNIGSDADTATLNVGTETPTGTRTILIGSSAGTQTTRLRGTTVSAGNSTTSTLELGATSTTTANLYLGNAPAGGGVVTYVRGNSVQIGTAAETNQVNIGDGASGTVRIERYLDGNSGTLSLGTDTTRTTSVEISRTGQTTTVQGNLTVNGTTNLVGTVSVSAVDSAAAGGSVLIGGSNAGFVYIGNTTNSTQTRITGPVILNDGVGVKSRIDRLLGGTLLVGLSDETTGAGTASSVYVGRSPSTGGTSANLDGTTVNVGANTYTSALNLGTSSTTSAIFSLGNAPTGQSTTANVLANTVNIGNSSGTATINIANAVSSSRSIIIGYNGNGNTTTVNGSSVNIGGSATTALVVGAATAGTNTTITRIRGDVVYVGDEANTETVVLGNGTAGSLRVNQFLDGSAGTLSIGSDTATTALTLGRTPNGGAFAADLNANIVGVGGSIYNTQINIGTSAPNSSRAINIGANSAGQAVSVKGVTLTLGDSVTSTLNLGLTTTTSATVTLGNPGGSTTTNVQGNIINIGSDAGTTRVVLGDGAVDTVRVNTALNGANTGLALGTNSTYTTGVVALGHSGQNTVIEGAVVSIGMNAPSGNVGIGRTGVATTLYGNVYVGNGYFDEDTAGGTLGIGTVNAGTITLGRSGQQLSVASRNVDVAGGAQSTTLPLVNLTGEWNSGATVFTAFKQNITNTSSASGSKLMDLQVGGSSKFSVDRNGITVAASNIVATGTVYTNGSAADNRLFAPAYGSISNNETAATVVASGAGTRIPFSYNGYNQSVTAAVSGAADGLTPIASGYYLATFTGSFRVSGAPSGSANNIDIGIASASGSVSFPGPNSYSPTVQSFYNTFYKQGLGNFASGDVINFSVTTPFLTLGSVQVYAFMVYGGGTSIPIILHSTFSVVRIGPGL